MKTIIVALIVVALAWGCNTENESIQNRDGKVLLLKVDYVTNSFEEGTELIFEQSPENMTVEMDYMPPGDFGYVKLKFKELNELLFEGTIHWMGRGAMQYPTNLSPANDFEFTLTADYVAPVNGFDRIYTSQYMDIDSETAWLAVQPMIKVREYLTANPSQKVKLFLYTPSIGEGDPKDWDWIILLYK